MDNSWATKEPANYTHGRLVGNRAWLMVHPWASNEPWATHGQNINPWKTHERRMGNPGGPWVTHGSLMESDIFTNGKLMVTHGCSMGNPLANTVSPRVTHWSALKTHGRPMGGPMVAPWVGTVSTRVTHGRDPRATTGSARYAHGRPMSQTT